MKIYWCGRNLALIGRWCGRISNRLSTLFLSIVLMLVIPILPVVIEWAKTSHVKNDNYLITAAVLAAALGVAAEHDFYRASYALLFLATIILYALTLGGPVATDMDRYAGFMLLAVAVGHVTERFWWHVVLNRSLTVRFKKSGSDGNE